ncbi:hypothetical protein BDD43_4377 [Mucilaginibacter gracilis]|uniref:Uncharacterized protein n=1 Tax=Mucilaginibacter gracilis TaxID=423350 RepID=A0A495J594_9SPHI|nr:hypothetical protein [Mucilaginibacter gracilis]RKR84150.1 hypothetical protein BDD43_4377 [Mucilaginibacter gracilis]
MYKRIIGWLLMLAVFTGSFSTLFIYAGFKLNKDYIAANLCVNRFNPGLHCNGKCYFMRKIRQAEEHQKKQAGRSNSLRITVSFFQEAYRVKFLEPSLLEKHKICLTKFNYLYTSQYLDAIFRPPKSLV